MVEVCFLFAELKKKKLYKYMFSHFQQVCLLLFSLFTASCNVILPVVLAAFLFLQHKLKFVTVTYLAPFFLHKIQWRNKIQVLYISKGCWPHSSICREHYHQQSTIKLYKLKETQNLSILSQKTCLLYHAATKISALCGVILIPLHNTVRGRTGGEVVWKRNYN